MELKRVLKPRTIENALAQIIIGVVFAIGYSAFVMHREKLEDRRLDQFRTHKKYS